MQHNISMIDKGFHDLNPLIAGCEDCAAGHSYGPAMREYYLIHYVESGKGTFYVKGKAYAVGAGEIFLVCPYETITYTADRQNPWSYIWVGFNGELAKKLDQLEIPVLPYRGQAFRDLLSCTNLNNTREEFVASRLFEILSEIFEDSRQEPNYELQVLNYIQTNYMLHITVEEIAEMIGLNRRYLSRIFKKYTGLSIQEYLIKTRLEHAASLLLSGYPVAVAAAMTGYDDPFHFSKMFKRRYGVCPKKFIYGNPQNVTI